MNQSNINRINADKIIGLGVVAVSEGQKLGVVKDIRLEHSEKILPFFLIEDEQWYKGAKIIKAADIIGIGEEAVMIESRDKISNLSESPSILKLVEESIAYKELNAQNKAEQTLGLVSGLVLDNKNVEVLGLNITIGEDKGPKFYSIDTVEAIKDGLIIIDDGPDEQAQLEKPDAPDEGETASVGIISEEELTDEDIDPKKELEKLEQPKEVIEKAEESDDKPAANDEDKSLNEKADTPDKKDASSTEIITEDESTDEDIEPKKELAKTEQPKEVIEKGEVAASKSAADDEETSLGKKPEKTDSTVASLDDGTENAKEKKKKSETSSAYKDLKQILEERQFKFMLGKKVDRDIADDEGNAIIKEGQEITKDVLEKAKKSHKFIVLSFCVKTDLSQSTKN